MFMYRGLAFQGKRFWIVLLWICRTATGLYSGTVQFVFYAQLGCQDARNLVIDTNSRWISEFLIPYIVKKNQTKNNKSNRAHTLLYEKTMKTESCLLERIYYVLMGMIKHNLHTVN